MSSLEAIDPNTGPVILIEDYETFGPTQSDLNAAESLEQLKADRTDTLKTLGYTMLLSLPLITAQAFGLFPLRS